MNARSSSVLVVLLAAAFLGIVSAEDPYIYFTFNVTYGTLSPLGVPQQVILINNEFPGPNINSTTNNNVIINVFNNLDEPFLLAWNGVQQRRRCWQDGLPGTNCPILPGTNWTYHFQVKDQIGSFYYYPSIGMQKAAGGFGGLRINSRLLIPVPFDPPADDFTIIINDWYTKSHTVLARILDQGRSLPRPAGILINGKSGKDSSGKDNAPMYVIEPGKTYRLRICNLGIRNALNFRIQGHHMKLVEMDGSHTVQNLYESLDVHLGQCYSVLITADQAPRDYYMVASTRLAKYTHTATAVIRYAGSKTPPSSELPPAPVGWAWSLNQFRTFRWNLTASAARPNPQGSYHYGSVNITRTVKLLLHSNTVDGKKRYGINGISHQEKPTPFKLSEYFGIADKEFTYDLVKDTPPSPDTPLTIAPSILSLPHRDYIEIIFENAEKAPNALHLNGYAFFAVGMGGGKWNPRRRETYNSLDAVYRHNIQVYPHSWAAVLTSFDNCGMWNLRSEIWEKRYLGQQLYISVKNVARSNRDEYSFFNTSLLCGAVVGLPTPPPYT